MLFRTLTLATAVAMTASLAGQAFAAPASVKATEVWCRAAPVGAPAGGCYVTLIASVDDRLLSVETPAAASGEVHTMSMDGGIMRMRKLADGLALPAGKAVSLRPGAAHLMIIGPKQPITAGRTIPLTLRFARAKPLILQAPVRAVGEAAAPMAHMDHH